MKDGGSDTICAIASRGDGARSAVPKRKSSQTAGFSPKRANFASKNRLCYSRK